MALDTWSGVAQLAKIFSKLATNRRDVLRQPPLLLYGAKKFSDDDDSWS
jgi:hypothetical protein